MRIVLQWDIVLHKIFDRFPVFPSVCERNIRATVAYIRVQRSAIVGIDIPARSSRLLLLLIVTARICYRLSHSPVLHTTIYVVPYPIRRSMNGNFLLPTF